MNPRLISNNFTFHLILSQVGKLKRFKEVQTFSLLLFDKRANCDRFCLHFSPTDESANSSSIELNLL